MRNLTKFVDDRNNWRSIFGNAPHTFPLTQADVTELTETIDCDLSPENLTCDGEMPAAQVRARAKLLHGAAADLAKYATENGFTQPETYCI
jgi:hypothetical protein